LGANQCKVRDKLRKIVKSFGGNPECLDVGGRKSPYTIGVPGQWTITDILRKTEKQEALNLGINKIIITRIKRTRSNVCQVLYDDMTRSSLLNNVFDCVVAVEVLEHIKEPDLFISNVHRVLKPGGVFLMTTPNADHPGRQGIVGPDDEIYYTKAELNSLLYRYFGNSVEIEYAVPVGRWHTLGLSSWSLKYPLRTILSTIGNFVTRIKDSREAVKRQAIGTRQLIAMARK
jgi:SAM-dependent methyltransferase